jgi:hypothetical protein
MKNLFLCLTLFLTLTISAIAQGTAGTNAKFEYRSLIDLPTAGILERGFVAITSNVMPEGTVIAKIEVGVFNNMSFGISYGGSNIIGTGEVDWYNYPGVNFRLRLVDETVSWPAITIGFDSQGKGKYYSDPGRFAIKSPGFFAAAAKNFEFLGYLSIHGLINYSLERADDDKDLNVGLGLEKTIGGSVSLIAEYDFAINDDNPLSFGGGNGYLNMALRWSVADGFTVALELRDLLTNDKFNENKADRGLHIEYITAIF